MQPEIRKGVFCCYDIFKQRDVRVEVVLPGTVSSYAVNQDGSKTGAVTEQSWYRVQVSSVLRALDALERDRGGLMRVPGSLSLELLDPLKSQHAEASFLRAAEKVFWEAHTLGSAGGGESSHTINLLTSALLQHFVASRRFPQAEVFFSKFRVQEPAIALIIAKIARHNARADMARILGLLAASILQCGHRSAASQMLKIEQSAVLRATGNNDTATAVAISALQGSSPTNFAAVLNLAHCYIASGDAMLALATLNMADRNTEIARKGMRLAETIDQATISGSWPAPAGGTGFIQFRTALPQGDVGLVAEPSGSAAARSGQDASLTGGRAQGPLIPDSRLKPGPATDVHNALVELLCRVGWKKLLAVRAALFADPEPAVATTERSASASSGDVDAPAAAAGNGSGGASTDRGDQMSHCMDEVASIAPGRSDGPPFGEDPYFGGRQLRKRACAPWLDRLFKTLHNDLMTLVTWKKVSSGAAAISMRSDDEWLSAALLSLRLKQYQYARLCLSKVRQMNSGAGLQSHDVSGISSGTNASLSYR